MRLSAGQLHYTENMERKHFDFSVFAVAIIIIAILFSACGISNSIDPSDNTTNPNENTTKSENISDKTSTEPDDAPEVKFSRYDCFVAPDPKDFPTLVEDYGSYDCVPGYLYFKKEVYGEIKLLLAKKAKRIPYHNLSETIDKVFIVTEDDEIVSINKQDGSYKTIYKAQYGTIDLASLISWHNKYMYYTDGDYIIRIDPSNGKSLVYTHSDNGITTISQSDDYGKVEGYFYCETCCDNKDGLVWTDNDYNCYWYHPETGENEKFDDMDDLYWRTDDEPED